MCLFRPGKYEWTFDTLVSKSIIPWAVEWLYYYEVWLATNEWCGGGEHPNSWVVKNNSMETYKE